MTLLGVDFGFKRIGLAMTDSEVGLPRALSTLNSSGSLKRDAEQIAAIAAGHQIDEIVVGLPVEESGEEGRMARICRQLGDALATHGFHVHYVDEGLTSVLSEGSMIDAGMKASQIKRRLDGEAAARILERFLANR